MRWHQKETNDVIKDLSSTAQGLSSEEAQKRLLEYGPNKLKEKKKKTAFMMFLDQFKHLLTIILIFAGTIASIVGEPIAAASIITIVVLNAIIGVIQEYKAEKAMEALKKMATLNATVIRDGIPSAIPTSKIVPGDIVLLEAGQIIPADMRLLKITTLKIEEAALTGESIPVEKHLLVLSDEHLPLGDRKNMAYQGTIVTYGRASGIVVATGMETEIGKIATMLQEEKELKTPLQQRLAVFSKKLAIAILIICSIVLVKGLVRGEPIMLMLLTAISLAVAAIPEALPAVLTITLALGAKKMVKQNALIRKLPAVETLGSVTYICSDKTGTLTLNKMTVEEMYVDGRIIKGSRGQGVKGSSEETEKLSTFNFQLSTLFTALAVSNDAQADASGNIIGDPTEIALYNIAKNNGFDKKDVEKDFPRIAEIPFDSDRKCMTTFHVIPLNPPLLKGWMGRFVSFTKGAIDVLIDRADSILRSGEAVKIDREEMRKINDKMAADGLRVLGIAMRRWDALPDDISSDNIEKDLIIIGLVGMMDPPREEARTAVEICKSAGIHPVMITGDHPITARAIAVRLGILDNDAKAIITGRELDELPMEEFEESVENIRVYARAAPGQKLKIVKALQDKGQYVAMTGDGVNDAPALKRANIGVAMGITGTDVSKEVSSMILLDDNFATIVKAVKEGRRLYDNVLKFIKYSITCNAGTLCTIFLAPFFGLPLPLVPIQILWMNLLTDSFPGLALTAEPAERRIMNRPPRNPNEGVFSSGRGLYIIKFGLIIGITALLFQYFTLTANYPWQTMVFTGLVMGRMAVVSGVRSENDLLLKIGVFSNKPLLGAIALTFFLQMAIIYIPFFNPIFNTQPLTLSQLVYTLAISSIVFFAIEAEKLIKRPKKCLTL